MKIRSPFLLSAALLGSVLLNSAVLAQDSSPAQSRLPGQLTRTPDRPVLTPQGAGWEGWAVFNPTVLHDGQEYLMLYRAQDRQGVSRVGVARSQDGVDFRREAQPIFVPSDPGEAGGVEDPRLVKIKDTYYLTYTAYDGKSTARLHWASSPELKNWTRLGEMVSGPWSKSGAMLNRPLDGLYFMYYGDKNIFLATSPDLKKWTAEPQPVLAPRPGTWDEGGVEPGPPPVLTPQGILLIYNGRDRNNVYAVGAALLDPGDPAHVLARTEKPILTVEREYEKTGTVPNVVFVEGMNLRDGKLEVWYGAGDQVIGRAEVPWPPED